MLEQIFKAMLVTSCAGAALTVVTALAKPLTKKYFSAGWNYYIWLAVMLVMMLPVRFAMPRAAFPIAEQPVHTAVTQTQKGAQTAAGTGEASVDPTQITQPEQNETPFSVVSQISVKVNGITGILAVIWLAAALILLASKLALYAAFVRRIKKCSRVIPCPELRAYTKRQVTVRICENISSPLTTGIFRRTLILPDVSLTETQLANILAHETTHINRNDILCKWLVTLVKCVHWFNPAVYFAAKQINAECEISCDSAVTESMSKAERLAYVDTILALISDKNMESIPFTTGMTGSRKMLERRFVMMTRNKRVSKKTRALSAALAAVTLAATVFSSGVLANDLLGNDGNVIRYEIYNGDKLIRTEHQPFIYGLDYYLPLRETLNGFGITDITYADGVATVTVPEDEGIAGYEDFYFRSFSFYINETYPGLHFGDKYNFALNDPAIIVDGTTYIPLESMSMLMVHYESVADFWFNVIKPTDPESYYESGEDVVIGTAAEQDAYTNANPGKHVKRIITDNDGKVIVVVPAENQLFENRDKYRISHGALADSFSNMLYNGVSYYKNYNGESFVTEDVYEVDKNAHNISDTEIIPEEQAFIAGVAVTDFVTFPDNEFSAGMKHIITNTYDGN